MVAILERILQLEPRHCREAALHGLNHSATAEERARIIRGVHCVAASRRKARRVRAPLPPGPCALALTPSRSSPAVPERAGARHSPPAAPKDRGPPPAPGARR